MLKLSARSAIRLRGVRHNNLKNFDLDLPLNQLIVITGLSGSGKSSLAFDTLFAEGQRRYIETFSPYARQFFDRMDKPQVDSIEGIPPAIAIEQRNSVKTTRSTVGTMTEICDYMKVLWPAIAQLHCRQCGRAVHKDTPLAIWHTLQSLQWGNSDLLLTFDLPLTEKLSLSESLALVARQGYQRLLVNGRVVSLEQVSSRLQSTLTNPNSLTVLQDRLKLIDGNRARFTEACEQAYHFGKGKLCLHRLSPSGDLTPERCRFSNRLHCAECDLEYREPSAALFSFNHPVGACPACRGFGRTISIDYALALPDLSRTLAQGVVKPWQTGTGAECQQDLMRMCRRFGIPTDLPFHKLPKKWQDFVINGEPNYGQDARHQWPNAWYGVKGYFRWLESKAYKMHVRVLLSRYRAYTPCPDCRGQRFQPEALLYRAAVTGKPGIQDRSVSDDGMTLADFYQLPVRDAVLFVDWLGSQRRFRPGDPLALVLQEVRSRLGYLDEVGLGYLTLDRPTRSLSGGETERVNLTTCLGSRLVNTLFVLDEPSVGLHPRDTERLVQILQHLRDSQNTVVVVEHEPSVMRAADQIVDLGPGHGAAGGEVVFQGSYRQILNFPQSLTGQYISGQKDIELPQRRRVIMKSCRPGAEVVRSDSEISVLREAGPAYGRPLETTPTLNLQHATRHNLHDVSVEIPLKRFVCVTGVSGSGKTTLVREVLLPAVAAQLKAQLPDVKASDRVANETNGDEHDEDGSANSGASSARLTGTEHLGRVILVDQSLLGKTPRSNPAVYIGAFDDIRELFAQSEPAKQRGLNASAFSFNSSQGQCERCRGAGFEKIEMQFLSDVFIRCPDCNGRRYREHVLKVKIAPERGGARAGSSRLRSLSIADLLESTVDEALEFLGEFAGSRPAQHALRALGLLQEVGLGYLKLGQPINTLSGGESQRLKLVRHLAESVAAENAGLAASGRFRSRRASAARVRSVENSSMPGAPPRPLTPTLFLFDEPTTGLHFDDVRVLLKVFQRLVESGHSVLVIEHNLDVIKCADWLIDLGPEAGDGGGRIIAQGPPEDVASSPISHTGRALRPVLAAPRTDISNHPLAVSSSLPPH